MFSAPPPLRQRLSLKRNYIMDEEVLKKTLTFIAEKLDEVTKILHQLLDEKDKPLK